MLSLRTPEEIALDLAARTRELRLAMNWTRAELAKRAGISASTLKHFELTGEIALKRLLKLCFTLHAIDGFEQLLQAPPATSLAELEKQSTTRKRGKRKTK